MSPLGRGGTDEGGIHKHEFPSTQPKFNKAIPQVLANTTAPEWFNKYKHKLCSTVHQLLCNWEEHPLHGKASAAPAQHIHAHTDSSSGQHFSPTLQEEFYLHKRVFFPFTREFFPFTRGIFTFAALSIRGDRLFAAVLEAAGLCSCLYFNTKNGFPTHPLSGFERLRLIRTGPQWKSRIYFPYLLFFHLKAQAWIHNTFITVFSITN